MQLLISYLQIAVSVLLVAAILLQQGGEGLGSAFGGGDSMHHTKRGTEKTLFIATITLAVLFILLALANILI
ncbi:MAG: preprotein translocase subunit SecG [Candidatus Ryanbacteria bacterium RIFCSPHIGHO2_02_FULL_45_43]|uniref:Protein-export membrane protein SecG n=1 Tax=Candidatus Ryanbacteria bacterium RIFCSPHIGHO2_01_45_13 TaxID=1802112 RepID=A0A1G2FTE9_9BACT|nr:MAG: preprotein translocase subunit SecG [Candidatus Ryanbacteria bacterium RIFCSPHIGHO2_01_45_13]OGZ41514.1 MAG: preprotein translocase subunit SecG [Candidatus Ryanbacteria bacterium RIFCSPHIGHO2_01_FULL_44_130]OGZ47981.1 MAG: preprotein translocase subunit SecG [Candidatus Ryanbacteria bacterium RIFCSPHIGHO2_02_FULL_45_43]OGZ50117.1 MAG: preprotein translocase subunit SecG [Candidatus Ryanbacteria bacterium RIFCSPHIGHO2_12_FULL_44_20]OGZ51119.1 MAG: preprotein translocase subunit SecG [Ca